MLLESSYGSGGAFEKPQIIKWSFSEALTDLVELLKSPEGGAFEEL